MNQESQLVKLSDVVEAQFGLVLTRKEDKSMSSPFKYQAIQGKAVKDGMILHEELSTFHSIEAIDPVYITKKDDILFKVTDPFDTVIIKPKEEGLVVAANYIILRVNQDKALPRFIAWYLNEEKTKYRIRELKQGTSIISIRTSELLKLTIELPPLDIQLKIVEFLQLADEELSLLKQLIQEKELLYRQIPNHILSEKKKWGGPYG